MGGDHPCPVCKATFTRPQHVARHMRSHTGDRPYKCTQCGDQFARSDLLSRHVNKCHSNNPLPPSGRNKGAAAQTEEDKRRACDQCNHSKVRCDYGIPCNKCIARKTGCTYAKPPRKTPRKGDVYANDTPANASTHSLGHVTSSHPQLSVPYLDPSIATTYSLSGMQPSVQLLYPPNIMNGRNLDQHHLMAPGNPYDTPSPNAPSLTASVSTAGSAGSSPDPPHLGAGSPPGGRRPRSSTVPQYQTQPFVSRVFPPGMNQVDFANWQIENGTGEPARLQQQSAYDNQQQLLAHNLMNGMQGSGQNTFDPTNVNVYRGQPGEVPPDWSYTGFDATLSYPGNPPVQAFSLSNLVAQNRTRHRYNDSSSSTGSLSDWTSSSSANSSNVHLPGQYDQPDQNQNQMSMAAASGSDGFLHPNMSLLGTTASDDLGSFVDELSRPSTSDGFTNAIDHLSLNDAAFLAQVAENPSLYESIMNGNAGNMPQTGPISTGGTPDLWSTYMSEPLGSDTGLGNEASNATPNQVNPAPQPRLLEKGLRPQLLSRLSKRSSMPNLVTPFGSGATPRPFPQNGADSQRQLHHPLQQQQQEQQTRLADPNANTRQVPVPPAMEDAENLKSYQQACLARAAPVLTFSPKRKGTSPPGQGAESPAANLASTLGISQASSSSSSILTPTQQQPNQQQQPARVPAQQQQQPPRISNAQTAAPVQQLPAQQTQRPSTANVQYWQQQQQQQPMQLKQDPRLHANYLMPNMPPFGLAPIPMLSPQTRFLSQSLLQSPSSTQRPSNKRLPSTTLGPDNAKSARYNHHGEEGENEFPVFEDDEYFKTPPSATRTDSTESQRRRRQSAPSLTPPTSLTKPGSANAVERQLGYPSRHSTMPIPIRSPGSVPVLVNN